MKSDLPIEYVEVLRLALAGDLPEILTPCGNPPSSLAVDLIEIDFLRGTRNGDIGDELVSNINITLNGRQYLESLDISSPEDGGEEREPAEVPCGNQGSSNASHKWHEKPIGLIAIGVAIVIIATFLLYLIGQHTDLLSPIVGKP